MKNELHLIKTKPNMRTYQKNLQKIFGDKSPTRGRWIQHPNTGEMIDASKYVRPSREQGPLTIVDKFEAIDSPITEEVITTKRKNQDHLKEHGVRRYEGFKTENIEAQRHRERSKRELDSKVMDTLHRTKHEIDHGYRQVKD